MTTISCIGCHVRIRSSKRTCNGDVTVSDGKKNDVVQVVQQRLILSLLLLLIVLAHSSTGSIVDVDDTSTTHLDSYNQHQHQQQVIVGKDGTIITPIPPKTLTKTTNDDDDTNKLVPVTVNNTYAQLVLLQRNNDTNLHCMTNYNNFYAFVRPPIESYYQTIENDSISTMNKNSTSSKYNVSMKEQEPIFQGLAGMFINISPIRVTLYRVSGHDKSKTFHKNSDIGPWGSGSTATFVSHTFVFTKYNNPSNIICTFAIQSKISIYYCNPYETTNETSIPKYKYSRAGIISNTKYYKSLTTLEETDKIKYNKMIYNLQFGSDYQTFTNGSPWLTYYPPIQPMIPIWTANYLNQIHTIESIETHFTKLIPNDTNNNKPLTIEQMKDPIKHFPTLNSNNYRNKGILKLQLKVVSCLPRVFIIDNFLSTVEVDHMMNIIQKQKDSLIRSTTSGHISSTRTSKTTWIKRSVDPIINTIYRRVADLLQINEALLRERNDSIDGNTTDNNINNKTLYQLQSKKSISEDIQIVHYTVNQQYTPHHDFGYPKGMNDLEQQLDRILNVAMNLNDVTSDENTTTKVKKKYSGTTAFPRWRNGYTNESLHIQPKRGTAVLFYLIHPDGNSDDLSQHAGSPILYNDQEKYFANLWIRSYL